MVGAALALSLAQINVRHQRLATVGAALLSWHLIEKRALRLKRFF